MCGPWVCVSSVSVRGVVQCDVLGTPDSEIAKATCVFSMLLLDHERSTPHPKSQLGQRGRGDG